MRAYGAIPLRARTAEIDKATRTHVLVVGLGQDWRQLPCRSSWRCRTILTGLRCSASQSAIRRPSGSNDGSKPDLDLIVEIAVLVCEGDEARRQNRTVAEDLLWSTSRYCSSRGCGCDN